MRVLVVTPWFPSASAAGSGIFNLRDAEMLAAEHEVTVLHLYDPVRSITQSEEVLPSGIRVKRVPFSTSKPPSYATARRAVVAGMQDADLVHTMAFPALLPVWLGRVGKMRSTPWVHTEHWSGLVKEHPSLLERVSRDGLGWLLKKPDAVVAVGAGLAGAVQKRRADPVEVIGNYVLLADGNAIVDAPALDSPPLRLIGVGGLVPWKGPIEAVETVAALRARDVEATLRWAGVGPLYERVQERASELGVADQVILLGQLSSEQLSRELSAAQIFLLPTAGETFGIAIAEALGHGLSVVTSGAGEHREFLPANAARVLDRHNSEDFAGAILDLIRDPQRWAPEDIAEYSRQCFAETHRRERYAAVYQRALAATNA